MFDEWYDDFASNISYYDFEAEDSDKIALDMRMQQALRELVRLPSIDRDSLAELIRSRPDLVHGIEVLLRDQTFSKGQWIYFLFDVQVLNRPVDAVVQEYVRSNLDTDRQLRSICVNLLEDRQLQGLLLSGRFPDRADQWIELVATFKASLVAFIKKPGAVNARLSSPNSAADRFRTADYLITRLGLKEFIEAVDIDGFVQWKRRARDTKGLHGSYGQKRLQDALERSGFIEAGKGSGAFRFKPQGELAAITSKQGRAKVFDFLLSYGDRVKAAIETNFYETEGTKIGINVEEYLDLARDVQRKTAAEFYWVTDGSSWLAPTGRRRLKQLYEGFSGRIYNYNTFERDLPVLMESWAK